MTMTSFKTETPRQQQPHK